MVDEATGLIKDFQVQGEFPKYGNDDGRVDHIAEWVVGRFKEKLGQQHAYRNSIPTLSVLTITSNVVYGKKTGGQQAAAGRGAACA